MTDHSLVTLFDMGKPSPPMSGGGSAIQRLERLAGGALPNDYVRLLLAHDGGSPAAGCFRIDGDNPDNIVGIDRFYSLTNPSIESIEKALVVYRPITGVGTLPIGLDGGGNQFFLQLDSSPPAVWICFLDEGNKRVKLADSFGEFVSGLFVNPDYI